jgi:hypothetical protein
MANVTVNTTQSNVVVTDVDTAQQINVTSTQSTIVVSPVGVATLPPGTIDNAIAAYDGNINTSGTITASAFVGDGSGLTNVGGGNVDSVNGQTGVVVLDTDDVAEANSLYFTTTRANTAIDDRVTAGFVNNLGIEYANIVNTPVLADVATSGDYDDLINTPTLATVATSGDYDDLINTPTLAAVATSGDYDDLINTPTLAAVATSGDYDDLINTPTNVSDFTNDAGYLVSANLASTTANVDSVNGETGVVVLDTDDVAEGNTNLYFSNTRVNAFIQDNITTTDIDEGTNLYFTTTRANSAIAAYQGSINTPGTITATAFTGDGSDLVDVRAETIEVTIKNVTGVSIPKGTPVHQTGFVGSGTSEVVPADAGNAQLMPAHFVAGETLAPDAEGRGIVVGKISGVDTSMFTIGDTIFVAVGGGYANAAPTGEGNLIQNLGVVTRIDATQGGGEVMGAGRVNATPNLNTGNIFIGNINNAATPATLDTSIVPENGNLYFSNARVNAFIQDNITTTDIDEGTNLYYTTDRANTAISEYQGDIDTPGNISASNYFGSDNLGSRITLSDDQVTHGALLGSANTYTVGNQGVVAGYAVLDTSFYGVPPIGMNLVANASLTTPIVTLVANLYMETGSNVITVLGLEEAGAFGGVSSAGVNANIVATAGNLATLMANITAGMTFNELNVPGIKPQPFLWNDAQRVYITSVNVAANTFIINSTPKNTYNANVGSSGFQTLIVPAGRDPATGIIMPFMSQYDVSSSLDPGTSKFIIAKRNFGTATNVPIANFRGTDTYAYPETGPITQDFEFSGGLTTNDLTLDMANVALKGRYVNTANNTTVNFPDGITVGANTISSQAGIDDVGINPCINVMWDGTKNLANEYNQFFNADIYQNIPTIALYAFSDGTAADVLSPNFNQGTAASTGPRITLGAASGNITADTADNVCRENQELGQLAFTGATVTSRAGLVKSPAAGIKVIAANLWDQPNANGTINFTEALRTPGNSDMYLYATSDIKTGRDLFISYKQGELNIGSGKLTNVRKPIKFSPVGTMPAVPASPDLYHLLNDPRTAYTVASRNWVTINSANITADSGSQITITNGGSLGAGIVGDQVFKIDRVDNTVEDNESIITFLTTGLLGFLYGQTGIASDAVGFGLPLTSAPILNGQSVSFANVEGQGANLNGNVYYVRAAPVLFSTSRGYTVYTDSGLTNLLTWQDLSGTTFGPGNFGTATFGNDRVVIYDVLSGVTGRDYTFRLAEQSEDLVISTNGNSIVTFTPAGNVTATGVVTANAFVGDGSGLTNVGNVDSVNGATGVVVLDTDDIDEGSNLYFSNARVLSAVESGNVKLKQFSETTSNLGVLSGNISANIDVATASIFKIQPNANITLDSVENATAGVSATLILNHQANNIQLSSTWKYAGNVRTLSNTTGSTDIISVFYDGEDYYASITKGYE